MATSNVIGRVADVLWALLRAREFTKHDAWPRERLLAYQRARFMHLVQHARAYSAFYGDLYQGIELDDKLDVTKLPIVTKRRLMEHFDTVVTDPRLRRTQLEQHLSVTRGDEAYLGQYRVVATAGTSGLRGIFIYNRDAWRTVLANTIRWQHFTGIATRLPFRLRLCSIGADSPMHLTKRLPQSGNVGLFRLRHIEATAPISEQVAVLNRFQPHALLPYPSIAALLAREQMKGRLAIRPEMVATHSELLTPEMARLIEQAWGCAPFNHYGLTEEPHIGTDCTLHTGIHLFEDTSMIEVVDDEYQRVPDGTTGTRYLLTNLYNKTQPVIRYEVTDMLCRAVGPCECGRPFALLSGIGGRAEDLLRLQRADGAGEIAIPPMLITLAIESFLGVSEYCAEHDPDGIHIRLVIPDPAERQRIIRELPERLRADITRQGAVTPPVTLKVIDVLDRSAQRMGKLNIVGRRHSTAPARVAS
jgi:phenylacetate-coenzyme A ligase PaaK-like adenylate-forming protein